MSESDQDYRLTLSVKNANILRAIDEAGFKSQAELCRLFDLDPVKVAGFINFRIAPQRGGQLKESAKELAMALGKLPEDLWTEQQLGMALFKNVASVDVSEDQLEATIAQLDREKTLRALKERSQIWPRTMRVLEMRFSDDEPTLKEVGKVFNIGKERVLQIEKIGIKRLRRAAEAEKLMGCK